MSFSMLRIPARFRSVALSVALVAGLSTGTAVFAQANTAAPANEVAAPANVVAPANTAAPEATDAAAPATTDVAVADPAAAERGFAVWKKQDCTGCHGWAGNGERVGENPEGPSLRASGLDAAGFKETILCGRPGTQMPYHDPRAYTDDRCYGMTKADVKGMQLLEGKPITQSDVDDLVAYITTNIQGKPDQPSQEDCKAYYNGKPFCSKYPLAADQAQGK